MSFWHDLQKPILALAPMEDVTDTAFRQVLSYIGKPDVMFTEFVSVEGFHSPGKIPISKRFKFEECERPLVAQIWGTTPEYFLDTSKELVEMGIDGIDINMGCPVRKIIKTGGCSALIKNPTLAKEIYRATLEGAGRIPVSIKTRIGFNRIQTKEWIGYILEEMQPEVLTVHFRTTKEQSKFAAHWEEAAVVSNLKDEIQQKGQQTLLLGNGDVRSIADANDKCKKYKFDGVMIGRGVFENPWVFNRSVDVNDITIQDRIDTLKLHLDLYERIWNDAKSYNIMKKFFKIYIAGFDNAKELRMKLMETESFDEAREVLKNPEEDRKYLKPSLSFPTTACHHGMLDWESQYCTYFRDPRVKPEDDKVGN